MIKVENTNKDKPERNFPCLLQGCSSKNYYYAKSKYKGFNLTSGLVVEMELRDLLDFSTNHFDDVYELKLSIK